MALGDLRFAHWGVGVVGGCYIASVVIVGGAADWWSPAIAVALLLSSELAGWSVDSRRRGRDDVRVHAIRLRAVVLLGLVGVLLAFLTHEAAIIGPGGNVSAALAVGALLAVVGALCWLMLRFRAGSA